MRTFVLFTLIIFLVFSCEDTGDSHSDNSEPETVLSPSETQEYTYNNMLNKVLGSTELKENERFRFMMIDQKRSNLHFISIRKKDQEYTLGAEFQTCNQIGNLNQATFDQRCKDLYNDEYSRLDQLIRTILESPRHDEENKGELEFYFQHYSMSNSVVYGTDNDIFALELYLAFLRLTQADESLIKTYEEKKNDLVGL